MSWLSHPLQPKETLPSLAAGSSWAVLWMSGLTTASFRALQKSENLLKTLVEGEVFETEAAAFSFGAAVVPAVTGGREKPSLAVLPQAGVLRDSTNTTDSTQHNEHFRDGAGGPCTARTQPSLSQGWSLHTCPSGALWAGHQQEFLFPQSISLLS